MNTHTETSVEITAENNEGFALLVQNPVFKDVYIEDLQWMYELACTLTAKGYPATVADVLAWVDGSQFAHGDALVVEAACEKLEVRRIYVQAVHNLQYSLGLRIITN